MCQDHSHHAVAAGNAMPVVRMGRRDLVRALWAGTVVAVSACTTNPETGNSNFTFFAPPDDQLAAMALQAWQDTKQQTPISRDSGRNSRLKKVGEKIALAANRPNDPWEFVVFESAEKNAFVLPGGKVGFYTGLMDFMQDDDQMAAVLGHEVGHVTDRHAAQRISAQTATQLGLAVSGVAVSASDMDANTKQLIMAAAGAGATLGISLPFSRQHELAADKLGVRYMAAAGYKPAAAVRLWERMGADRAGAPPEWASTHPSPETRIRELREYINNNGYGPV